MSNRPQSGRQQAGVTIENPNELPMVECVKCGGTVFTPGRRIRRLSEIHPQNPTGKQLFVHQDVAVCVNPDCRAILPENP